MQSVLVVQNQQDVCARYEAVLGPAGYVLMSVQSAGQALACLRELQPDVLLIDLRVAWLEDRKVLRTLLERATPARIIVHSPYGGVGRFVERELDAVFRRAGVAAVVVRSPEVAAVRAALAAPRSGAVDRDAPRPGDRSSGGPPW